jgi:hypothetical protein
VVRLFELFVAGNEGDFNPWRRNFTPLDEPNNSLKRTSWGPASLNSDGGTSVRPFSAMPDGDDGQPPPGEGYAAAAKARLTHGGLIGRRPECSASGPSTTARHTTLATVWRCSARTAASTEKTGLLRSPPIDKSEISVVESILLYESGSEAEARCFTNDRSIVETADDAQLAVRVIQLVNCHLK